jgi:hypothetical protein
MLVLILSITWRPMLSLPCAADDGPGRGLPHTPAWQALNVSDGSVNEHGLGISTLLEVRNGVDLVIQRHVRQSIQVCP